MTPDPLAPVRPCDAARTVRRPLARALLLVLAGCCLVAVVGLATGAPTPATDDASAVSGANVTFEAVAATDANVTVGASAAAPTAGATATAAAGGVRVRAVQQECFPKDAYEAEAGGFVEVTVNCGGYLLIGGDRQEGATAVTNYLDVLYIPGGGRTFTINTRLLGTDAPSSEVFSNGVVSYAHELPNGAKSDPSGEFSGLQFETADGTDIPTLAALRDRMDISTPPRPLRPKRYRLLMTNGTVVLRDDGIAYADDPVDRSNLKLVQPEIDLQQPGVYIAPQGSAAKTDDLAQLRTVWTQRDRVAKGDRLVIGGFSTDGLHGTLGYLSESDVGTIAPDRAGATLLRDLVYDPEGVNLTIEQTDPAPNTEPVELSLDTANEDGLSLVFGPQREEFYLVIDTRKQSVFDRTFSPNATFEVTYTIRSTAGERFEYADTAGAPGPFEAVAASDPDKPDQYPYFGVDEEVRRVSTEFTVVEPTIEYTRLTRDGEVIVSNGTNERIPGYTNYAPGTNIGIQLISEDEQPPERIEINEVTIRADGDFRPSVDLSALSREYPVEIETFLRERLYDRRPIVLARDPGDPARFEITESPANVTVAQGRPLSAFGATITNTGVDVGAQFVTLRAGEHLLGNQSVFVPDGQNRTIDYGTTRVSLPVGTYEYSLDTDEDTASGTLVVQATPTPTPIPTTTTPPPSTAVPETTGTTPPTSAPTGTTPPATSPPPSTAPPTDTATSTARGTNTSSGGSDGGGFLSQSFLGLGLVSVRDALGGAVIVSAAYVVGYWK